MLTFRSVQAVGSVQNQLQERNSYPTMSNQNPDGKKDISFQSGPGLNERTSHRFNNIQLSGVRG